MGNWWSCRLTVNEEPLFRRDQHLGRPSKHPAWLVVAEQYGGLMVEGDPRLVERIRRMVVNYSIGAECVNMFVKMESVPALRARSFRHDPDVFSLDIDGNDYYIAKAIFEADFRPKISVVEYAPSSDSIGRDDQLR